MMYYFGVVICSSNDALNKQNKGGGIHHSQHLRNHSVKHDIMLLVTAVAKRLCRWYCSFAKTEGNQIQQLATYTAAPYSYNNLMY